MFKFVGLFCLYSAVVWLYVCLEIPIEAFTIRQIVAFINNVIVVVVVVVVIIQSIYDMRIFSSNAELKVPAVTGGQYWYVSFQIAFEGVSGGLKSDIKR